MGSELREGYEVLIEIEGWSLYKDHREYEGEAHFISHDACPKGIQLEVKPDSECSVVHWKYQRCQRCEAYPPEGMMALFFMYCGWEPCADMNEWKEEYAHV